jgi:hypothetical protein
VGMDIQANYVIQQYAMTKLAFWEIEHPYGKIFHHRLRDEFIRGSDGTYGLIGEDNNEHWPAFYAAWLTTYLLGDTTLSEDKSGTDYKHLVFDGRDGERIHVLWAIVERDVEGVAFANIEARIYRQSEAQVYYEGTDPEYSRISELTLPGSQSENGGGGNDPYQGAQGNEGWQSNYHVGGETYILVERSDDDDDDGAKTLNRFCIDWWVKEGGGGPGFDCGTLLIRNSLANAGVTLTDDDPPVPGILFSTVPYPPSPDVAWQLLSVPATYSDTHLSASLVVSHTVLSSTLQAEWTTDAWVGAQFTTLSAPQAQVYDEDNVLVAEGAVQARPAAESAVALAMGNVLIYTIRGDGFASFYAPATDGLGIGGTWQTYTAQVQSHDLYGIGLEGAAVTVNGQEYMGQLVLFTSDPVTLQGRGHTFSVQVIGWGSAGSEAARRTPVLLNMSRCGGTIL